MKKTEIIDLVQGKTESMTPEAVRQQINLIQHVMRDAMSEDVHYGIIPGTQKPMLFKAGADHIF